MTNDNDKPAEGGSPGVTVTITSVDELRRAYPELCEELAAAVQTRPEPETVTHLRTQYPDLCKELTEQNATTST